MLSIRLYCLKNLLYLFELQNGVGLLVSSEVILLFDRVSDKDLFEWTFFRGFEVFVGIVDIAFLSALLYLSLDKLLYI